MNNIKIYFICSVDNILKLIIILYCWKIDSLMIFYLVVVVEGRVFYIWEI